MNSCAEAAGKIGQKGEELLRTLEKRGNIAVAELTLCLQEIVDLAGKQNPLIENLFKTTLYSIGDAVIATGREGRITLLNPVAEQLTGWREKDAEGRPLGEVFRIISEESREAAESPVEKVLREGVVVGLANHTLLISKQGKEIPIADSGAPVLDEKGQISGVVLVFRDQTNEREKNRKIQESEKKYKTLFNNRSVIMLLIDPKNGNIVDANPAAGQFYGWPVKQLKRKNITRINLLSKEEVHKEMELAKVEKRNLFKFRHQLANGEIRDVEVYSNPIEIDGVPLLYSIIHDVTHRNELEAKYNETQSRLLA
ncbi:diguanylate cyclase/phosphodiesterase (GGDEF & EAL domains) with PAS/PAC sensor(s), partial [hydrothermal vent metagenome]